MTSTHSARGPGPTVPGGALGAGAVLGLAVLLDVPVMLAPTLATLTWLVTVLVRRRRRREAAARRRELVMDAVEAMLGELTAGKPPGPALERATDIWPRLAPASAAHRLGSDVAGEIRAVANLPGARAVGQVAAAWELCGASGVSLADALEQVLASVRVDLEVRLAIEAELAAARATVRLIAVLPVLVLSMGSGIGADPWQFLVGSHVGQICLWAGVTLMALGVMWLERIADQALGEAR